jgi:PAS domain S-box-containing protein
MHACGAGGASERLRFADILREHSAKRTTMKRDLDELEKRWGLAIQSAQFGVWDLDVPAQSVHYSPQWKAMLGYADVDEADATQTWRDRVHPDDREPMLRSLTAHLEGRQPGYEQEFRIRAADGSFRWVLSRGQVVARGPGGEPLRAIGTLTDLTDRREAERLRAERDRAEAASRAKTEFLQRMSHELRTPLNAVLGFAQVMSRQVGQASEDEQRRQLEQIERAGWQLLKMVDDVLDLASLDNGQLAMRIEPVALAPLVRSVCDALLPLARERALQIQSELSAHAVVLADRRRLRQVVSNLVGNAIKYNRRGGSVAIEAAAAGETWTLSVTDTGPGIPLAQMPHLFEPFNRLGRGHAGPPGIGIGLALARSLVETMSGSLSANSSEGVGSRFELTMPMAAD